MTKLKNYETPILILKPSIELHNDNTRVQIPQVPPEIEELPEEHIYIDNGTAKMTTKKGYPSVVVGELPLNNVYPEFDLLTGIRGLSNVSKLIKKPKVVYSKQAPKKHFSISSKATTTNTAPKINTITPGNTLASKSKFYLNAMSPGTKEFYSLPKWKLTAVGLGEAAGFVEAEKDLYQKPSIPTAINAGLAMAPYAHIVFRPINNAVKNINRAVGNYKYFNDHNYEITKDLFTRLYNYDPFDADIKNVDELWFLDSPGISFSPIKFIKEGSVKRLFNNSAYYNPANSTIRVNPLTMLNSRSDIRSILAHEIRHHAQKIKKGMPLSVYDDKIKYYKTNPDHPLAPKIIDSLTKKNKKEFLVDGLNWTNSPDEFDSELTFMKEKLYQNTLDEYKDFEDYDKLSQQKILNYLSDRFAISKKNVKKMIDIVEGNNKITYIP